jgi:hypothetical protein
MPVSVKSKVPASRSSPKTRRAPDWKSHFDWLRKQNTKTDAAILREFEAERRRRTALEDELSSLK